MPPAISQRLETSRNLTSSDYNIRGAVFVLLAVETEDVSLGFFLAVDDHRPVIPERDRGLGIDDALAVLIIHRDTELGTGAVFLTQQHGRRTLLERQRLGLELR